MLSPMKFIEKLAEEEDDELIKILKDEYWHLLFLFMVFPRWKQRLLTSFGLVLFHSFATGLLQGFFMYGLYLALLERNWEQVSLFIHFMILTAFAMFQPLFFNGVRTFVARIHRTLAKDVGAYSSGRIYAEQSCIEINEEIRIQSYYYLSMPVVAAIVGGLGLVGPYLSKWYSGVEHPYTSNGLSLKLPIAMYFPFPTDKGVVHYVIVGTQLILVIITTFLLVTPQIMCIKTIQKMKYEIRVIGYGIDSLVTRSMGLTGKYNTNNIQGKFRDFRVIKDTEFQRTVGLCMKEIIIHHQTMTGIMSTLKTIAKAPFAAILILGQLVIGISLYNILMALKANEIGTSITFVLLILVEIQARFVACSLGATLTEQTEILREKLYFIEWHNFDMENRRLFFNFQTVIKEPYVLKGGGIVEISMATFSTILNRAYSFFNIMRSIE